MQTNPKTELLAAICSLGAGTTCLLFSGSMYTTDSYVYKMKDGYTVVTISRPKIKPVDYHKGLPIQKLGSAIASFGFYLSSFLMIRRLDDEITFYTFQRTNMLERRQHYEDLRSENAIHWMNMEAQIARAKRDAETREYINSLVSQSESTDEDAENELEEQMYAEKEEQPNSGEQEEVENEELATLPEQKPPSVESAPQQPHVLNEPRLPYELERQVDNYLHYPNLFIPMASVPSSLSEEQIILTLWERKFEKYQIISIIWGVDHNNPRFKDYRDKISDVVNESPTPKEDNELSLQTEKLFKYLSRSKAFNSQTAKTIRDVQRSKCLGSAKAKEIEEAFDELVALEIAALTDEGSIFLT